MTLATRCNILPAALPGVGRMLTAFASLALGILLENNYIHDITLVDSENVSPHTDCFQTWSTATSITFEQNKCILDYVTSGNIQVAMIEDIYGPVSGLVFKNNIFIGQYRGINSVSTGSGISGLTVKENTFENMAEEGVQLTN